MPLPVPFPPYRRREDAINQSDAYHEHLVLHENTRSKAGRGDDMVFISMMLPSVCVTNIVYS